MEVHYAMREALLYTACKKLLLKSMLHRRQEKHSLDFIDQNEWKAVSHRL
jgi:hypothetical protein